VDFTEVFIGRQQSGTDIWLSLDISEGMRKNKEINKFKNKGVWKRTPEILSISDWL